MEEERIQQMIGQNYNCAQIMAILGLERLELEDDYMVKAMTGLGGGLGGCGKNCGALTGAVCMMGLFAGRGRRDEKAHADLEPMIEELVEWFQEIYGSIGGSVDCSAITGTDPTKQREICPDLIAQTGRKALELLEDYGF